MFNLNFTNKYKVVHINNELGNCVIGGAGTYMNELYRYRSEDVGFIYMGLGAPTDDYNISDFMEQKDIMIMNKDEAYKLVDIHCDVFVVQFYEFATLLDKDIIKDKKLVYVIHSVPTPEPPPPWDPFGGNYDIREKFEKLCNLSTVLVCVSEAEKQKLSRIYPQYEEKIKNVEDNYSNVQLVANNLGIDIKKYTDIVDDGKEYVAENYFWKSAGFFWMSEGISNKIEGLTLDEGMVISTDDINYKEKEKYPEAYEKRLNMTKYIKSVLNILEGIQW